MKTMREMVSEFHRGFNMPIGKEPKIPSDDRMRLRMRLIVEEFFETLNAVFPNNGNLFNAKKLVDNAVAQDKIKIDFPELIDGLADLDYVNEGCRLECGVNGEPIAMEVHKTNMAKLDGATVREDGKIIKPKNWQPPNIEAELIKQGWKK